MLMTACVLIFLSVTLLIGAFGVQITLAPRRAALARLRDIQHTGYNDAMTPAIPALEDRPWWRRLLPRSRKDWAREITVIGLEPDSESARLLLYAGYRSKSSLRGFQIARLVIALVLGSIPFIVNKWKPIVPALLVLLFAIMTLGGYLLPKIFIRFMAGRRQHRLRLSLPDALDLLVVCVEAGMGLNQAIVRVSEELRETQLEIADEGRVVNLEIRAGRTRAEALRNLGERTGVDDISSLASMIIQTDRFGTSIARSLRVHSDALRIERRQRAEEAAAKTTIKLIFPLVLCIFPSLFVVILGPAGLHIFKAFAPGGLGQ